MVDGRQLDDKEQETETVEIVGEVEVDDKTDRPRSEQVEFQHLHMLVFMQHNVAYILQQLHTHNKI